MLKKLLGVSIYFFCFLVNIQAQWIELGTGANALKANSEITYVVADKSGNVYTAGAFTDSANQFKGERYVAKWNGTSWMELGTDSNSLNANGLIRTIAVDDSGNVYAAGEFTSTSGSYYVAKWNGSSWSQLGTGVNALNSGIIYTMCLDDSGNVYVAGYSVMKWDGVSWTELGTGDNSLNANAKILFIAVDDSSNVYAAGEFTNTGGNYYVAKWNGSSWNELGAGANSLAANGVIESIGIDRSENIYVAGWFKNTSGNEYVAKWNGSSWSELGAGSTGFTGTIWTICIDSMDNVYASGYYVQKWDGTTWDEVGGSFNQTIWNIFVDNTYNIYAAGVLTDNNAQYYIAKYSQATVTGITNNSTNNITLSVYPNPTNNNVTINAPEAGQLTVYNLLGEVISIQNAVKGNNTVSLEKATNGIYTLILTGQNGNYTPIKVIKD